MPVESVEPRFEIRQLISGSMNMCWKKSRPGIDLEVTGHKFKLIGADLSNSMPSFALLEFNLEGEDDDSGIVTHVNNITLAFYVNVSAGQHSIKVQIYYRVGNKSLGAITTAERNRTETMQVTPQLEPAAVATFGLNMLIHSLREDIHVLLNPGAALHQRRL